MLSTLVRDARDGVVGHPALSATLAGTSSKGQMAPVWQRRRLALRRRILWGTGAAGVVAVCVGLLCGAPPAAAALPQGQTFSSTGAEQTYVVPAGVTAVHVEAIGGNGAAGQATPAASGGAGGHGADVEADLPVSPGQTLYVEVGASASPASGAGGYNGGGAAGGSNGGGGGGAADVRICSRAAVDCPAGMTSLASRLLVAGGGGGGGAAYPPDGSSYCAASSPCPGANGGDAGANGMDATGNTVAFGGSAGTATAGGAGGLSAQGDVGIAGGTGTGGHGGTAPAAGGGGGGGLNGGGGGGGDDGSVCCSYYSGGGGGGGGASFAETSAENVSIRVAASNVTPHIAITPVQGAPQASTGTASYTQTTATLRGAVDPDGLATTYQFEYGPTADYGSLTRPATLGSGAGDSPVSTSIAALQPGTAFHYRLVATNAAGTSLGPDESFTTAPNQTAAAGTGETITSSASAPRSGRLKLIAGIALSSLRATRTSVTVPVFSDLAARAALTATPQRRAGAAVRRGGRLVRPSCRGRTVSARLSAGRARLRLTNLMRGCTYGLRLSVKSSDGQSADDRARLVIEG